LELVQLKELYQKEYTLKDIVAMHQYWGENGFYSCIGKPKRNHSLIYFFNASAIFTMKTGEKVNVSKGDILYTPIGSEYSVKVCGRTPRTADSMIIHFLSYDSDDMPISLHSSYEKITPNKHDTFLSLFHQISDSFETGMFCPAMAKSITYEILSLLSKNVRSKFMYNKKFWKIKDGIEYMENSRVDKCNISEVAAMCGVSESCFRTLFREYSGKTPVAFLLDKKMALAKQLLSENLLNITEVATLLGFVDVYYFSKLFRKKIGVSPSQYLKEVEEVLD